MKFLFKLLSYWPLSLLHAIGAVLGWWVYLFSFTYRHRFQAHRKLAGYSASQVRSAVGHAGRMVAELPRLWFGPAVPVAWEGVELIDAAHQAEQGILLLTPHLGCFEVIAQAYALRYAAQGKTITVLYRPARKSALQTLIRDARERPGLHAAPTTLSGVKTLVKALRSGQTLGILPDQVPPQGLGAWADFFGKSAYSMTLPARLATQTGAKIILIWGERLPRGAGYCIHVRPLNMLLSNDSAAAAAQINAAMEALIRECPQQYLWGYARYKQPRADVLPQPSPGADA
jgi:Kdo2-lipid IVA lauroyltransferase/acyltransferase